MSDTPINLSKARKARKRAEARAKADANALRFGRSKARKTAEDSARTRAIRTLDGHRRDTPEPE